jgi:hypothetical protein
VTTSERYLLLGLRLGRHVEGLVDAYYGPPELSDQVVAEELVAPADLAAEADLLLSAAPDGWVADQLRGLRTYAGVLAGEAISYVDEVEQCYGVRPSRVPEDVYAGIHERLDELLPGDGTLFERREAWRTDHQIPGDVLVPALRDVVADLRVRARDAFGLPEGEDLWLEEVRDEPWWAFNYYQGGLQSRVVVNADVPTTGPDLIGLAAHEAYAGHHLEHAWKEQLLVQEQGLVEESIFLVPTTQSLLSEGIAETGEGLLLDETARTELHEVLAGHGIHYDVELAHELDVTLEGLRPIGLDAALMIHDEGRPAEEAQKHIERWSLRTPEQAAHSVSFVLNPTWRGYIVTYSAGRDLCRRYVGGDLARFRRLLTEQVRVRDLTSVSGP